MTITAFISLCILLLAGQITPGPNNALLSSSGMRFGWRATQPHAWGIFFGHTLLEFLVALGLGKTYQSFPIVEKVLTVVAVVVLCYLAYKIATAPVDKFAEAKNQSKPWTFWQSFMFQFINPKAWLIAIGVAGQFASGDNVLLAASLIGLATLCTAIFSTQGWTLFGVAMARVLNTPLKRRIFNVAMAAMLILSILMLVGFDFSGDKAKAIEEINQLMLDQ